MLDRALTNLYARAIDVVVRYPRTALLVAAVATLAFAAQLPKLYVDPDVSHSIPQDDPSVVNERVVEETFGSPYRYLIVVVREDHPDGVYNPETLDLVARLVAWLQSRPEFETARGSDLTSLATTNDLVGTADGIDASPFFEHVPESRDDALAVKAAVEDNGIYFGNLVSRDGRATLISVRESARGAADRESTYRLLDEEVDSLFAGRPEVVYLAGRPVVEALFNRYIREESTRLLPYLLAAIALFLFLSFRTLRGVAIPFAVIVCTEIAMLGFLAAWGHPFYPITAAVPLLIVTMSVADSIHLLAAYDAAALSSPRVDTVSTVRATMADMGSPVFMTSATTVIGFLSMLTSVVPSYRDFGVVISVGIVAALLLTLLIIPAVLVLLPSRQQVPAASGRKRETQHSWLVPALTRSAVIANRHPRTVVTAFVLLMALAGIGWLRLETDSSYVGYFPPGHHLRNADDAVNAHLAGSSVLDVLVDGSRSGAIKEPAMLTALDQLQMRLASVASVGDTLSLAEMIKRMSRVMNEDRSEAELIPSDEMLVSQYLLLYSMSGDPTDFDDLVDYDYRFAHVQVFLRDPGTANARHVVEETEQALAEIFPPGTDTKVETLISGLVYTTTSIESYVEQSQLSTLFISLPAIFLLTWYMFRRLSFGLLCVLPVVFAVGVAYGVMGLLGIPTDYATVMVGCFSLGVGVDFAIHYLHRYLAETAHGADHATAARVTAETAGVALFYNAIVLVAGFLTLLFARMYPQMKLGAFVATTMVICYATTMYLFPAILALRARHNAAAE